MNSTHHRSSRVPLAACPPVPNYPSIFHSFQLWRVRWFWFLSSVAFLLVANSASGAIVLLKSGQQLRGFVVRQNDTEVVLSIPLANGRREERRFARAEVDDVILTVSSERLEKLDPARPTEYRDYAEELAEKREDPEAREAALRLYLLAAALDPAKLGRSSFLAMASLARSPAEARSFRAMSFLLDPAHDRRAIETGGAVAVVPPAAGGNAAAREFLRQALKAFRQGKSNEAVTHLKRPGVAEEFAALSKEYPYDDFLKACQNVTKSFVPPSILVRALEMEIALGGEAGMAPPAPAPASKTEPIHETWSATISAGRIALVRPLRIDSVTEWDPRENRYRAGKWQAE